MRPSTHTSHHSTISINLWGTLSPCPYDTTCVSQTKTCATEVSNTSTLSLLHHSKMAFSDEVDEITRDVRRFTATQLRAKFPYMKTPAFQKVLNDVAAHLRVGLVQQYVSRYRQPVRLY